MKTEADILKALWSRYNLRDYKLNNSFVYSWECDFFSMTKTGYAYEVEVKVSRSDFKADFKKEKHNYFSQIVKGQKRIVLRQGLVYYVKVPNLIRKVGENGRGERDEKGRVVRVPDGTFNVVQAHTRDLDIPIRHRDFKTKLISSTIKIFKPRTPNKFYYAVPEGLISKDEVPDYAGLLYVNRNEVKEVKKAPFIHKEKIDLTKVLLSKFYYLSLRQQISINNYKNPVNYNI